MGELAGYWGYWHGNKGYSGVALLVRKDTGERARTRPEFSHPPFDHESRIVTVKLGELTIASIYVPNGGKDYVAKLRFLQAMDGYAASFQATGAPLVMCGDFNVARTDQDVHPLERKREAIGQRAEERALIERILSRGLVDVGRQLQPDAADYFSLVGALAEPAPAQRRLAAGLRVRVVAAGRARRLLPVVPGGGHQRSRAGAWRSLPVRLSG